MPLVVWLWTAVAELPPETSVNLQPTAEVSWRLNTEEDVLGYRVHYGFAQGAYDFHLDVGATNSVVIPLPLPGRRYFFAVTAYDLEDLESEYSAAVAFDADGTIPARIVQTSALTVPEDSRLPLAPSLTLGDRGIDWLLLDAPLHGQIESTSSPPVYVPATNFFGIDHFSILYGLRSGGVQVLSWDLDVAAQNDLPIVPDPPLASVGPGATIRIPLTGTDVENARLTFEIVTPPSLGTAILEGDTVVYTAKADSFGLDAFHFRAWDGEAWSRLARAQIAITAGTELRLGAVRIVGSPLLRFEWNTVAGHHYQVVSTDDLTAGVWTPASPVLLAQGPLLVWLHPVLPVSPSVFYRAVDLE